MPRAVVLALDRVVAVWIDEDLENAVRFAPAGSAVQVSVRAGGARAEVTVADTRAAPPHLPTLQTELPGVRFVAGDFTAALVDGQNLTAVYRSPGLSPETIAPVADAARAVGLPVGGELDLFARALADLAIVETKSAGAASEVDRLLWRAGHRPVRISKYGAGMAALHPDLPRLKWHRVLDTHLGVPRAA